MRCNRLQDSHQFSQGVGSPWLLFDICVQSRHGVSDIWFGGLLAVRVNVLKTPDFWLKEFLSLPSLCNVNRLIKVMSQIVTSPAYFLSPSFYYALNYINRQIIKNNEDFAHAGNRHCAFNIHFYNNINNILLSYFTVLPGTAYMQ